MEVYVNWATGRNIYFLRRFVVVRLQKNGWYEPCKSRDLRTVLWGAGGEIPPAYPAGGDLGAVAAAHVLVRCPVSGVAYTEVC